jgi:hypothetical protein
MRKGESHHQIIQRHYRAYKLLKVIQGAALIGLGRLPEVPQSLSGISQSTAVVLKSRLIIRLMHILAITKLHETMDELIMTSRPIDYRPI